MPAVHRFLNLGGSKIYVEIYGQGKPLVFLHGGMGFDASYLKVPGVLDLTKKRVRVILYDQRGHGKSSASLANKYTHATWISDLRQLTARLGLQKFSLLGHSYGGYLALLLAIRNPTELDKLILVATAAGPINTSGIPVHKTDQDLKNDVSQRWSGLFYGQDKHWEVLESINFHHEPFNAAFHRELKRYDVRNKLKEIQVETQVIVGEQDEPFLSECQTLNNKIPNSRLAVIADSGHFPFIERPNEFKKVVSSFINTS